MTLFRVDQDFKNAHRVANDTFLKVGSAPTLILKLKGEDAMISVRVRLDQFPQVDWAGLADGVFWLCLQPGQPGMSHHTSHFSMWYPLAIKSVSTTLSNCCRCYTCKLLTPRTLLPSA